VAASRIHTIGYQHRTGEDLVRSLVDARIRFLVDVRAVPMSRKPDFRKNRLISLLEEADIRYMGMPTLGTPKFLRDKLAADGNYDEFFAQFRNHVETVEAHMASVGRLAERRKITLMCFERDANECHRLVLAENLSKLISSPVVHL
jgi:uncharacterized protein (DUF488 family)